MLVDTGSGSCDTQDMNANSEAATWTSLAYKLGRIQLAMRDGGCELQAEEFLGESLRQLLTGAGSGFVSWDEHMLTLDMNRKVDRANAEQAQKTADFNRADYVRKLADARHIIADAIRVRVNEVTVPAKLRREGVLLAAEWIDPAPQKDLQYVLAKQGSNL